jgi:endonuclease/exonuclease/phosphatase family metal-dependent hydrolase
MTCTTPPQKENSTMFKQLMAAGSAAALIVGGTILGAAPALASPAKAGDKTTDVTVMSFNIHYGADGDNNFNLERAASVIEDSGAEIIGLQEVDNHWGARSEFLDEASWLAERLDMHVVYGANLDEPPLPGDPDNRQYGTAILSEYPIISSANHLLTNIEYEERPTEQRGLLEAVVNIRGTHLSFYNTHLDFQREEQRALQVKEIIDITSSNDRPAVIVGDLNATPDAPELQPLFSIFTDSFAALGQNEDYTFAPDLEGLPGSGSVENPTLRIDYILTARGATATSAEVIKTTASDHLPIIAELSVTKSPNGLLK